MGEETQEREAVCSKIKKEFEAAGVGALIENYSKVPHATVRAYINHNSGWHMLGPGWQRQAMVCIPDDGGEVSVFMTGLYRVPDGKQGRDLEIGDRLPLLFKSSRNAPGWVGAIVDRIRQASQQGTDTIEVKVIQLPPPPVALENLLTLGDLIDAHEKYYLTDQYHVWLKRILSKLGKVHHRGEEWFVDLAGPLCHSETAPESPAIIGPDGEPVIHTNAAYIKLDAYRELISHVAEQA